MMEQGIQLQDRIVVPAGHVVLEVVDRATGEVVKVKNLGNVVVNTYREYLKYLLAGEDMVDYTIETMRIGTSGVAAAVTDVAITDPPGGTREQTVTHVVDGTAKTLTMTTSFGVGAWDGEVFQEVGLIFANGGLAARRTFGSMTKGAEFTWNWSWTFAW